MTTPKYTGLSVLVKNWILLSCMPYFRAAVHESVDDGEIHPNNGEAEIQKLRDAFHGILFPTKIEVTYVMPPNPLLGNLVDHLKAANPETREEAAKIIRNYGYEAVSFQRYVAIFNNGTYPNIAKVTRSGGADWI